MQLGPRHVTRGCTCLQTIHVLLSLSLVKNLRSLIKSNLAAPEPVRGCASQQKTKSNKAVLGIAVDRITHHPPTYRSEDCSCHWMARHAITSAHDHRSLRHAPPEHKYRRS